MTMVSLRKKKEKEVKAAKTKEGAKIEDHMLAPVSPLLHPRPTQLNQPQNKG